MNEIILAEHRGNTWLVGGEEHIDDFLANTLPADVSIRIVACQSESEYQALWNEHGGKQPGFVPWAINPAIAARARGTRPGHNILFGPWSALLDDTANAVLRDAATGAARDPDSPVVLLVDEKASEPKPMADLTNLRVSLIGAALTSLGVAESRVVRAVRPGDAGAADQAECDRIEIAFKSD